MKTIEVKLYKFEELSEEAKEKAIEKWRSSETEYHHGEEYRDTLKEFEKSFPVKVTDWEISPWSYSYVKFDFTSDEDIGELSGIRLMKYLWNNHRRDLYKGKWYQVHSREKISHPRIRSEKLKDGYHNSYRSAITLTNSCVLTGWCVDEDILEPIYKFLESPDNRTFESLLEECLESWRIAWEKEMEYESSDEYISETIIANEYDFTEDGEMY
jgi:RecG-like helicase